MSIVLTQLESDLLSDLAKEARTLRDLVRFVELHSDLEANVSADSTLQALLDRWSARAWVATGESSPNGGRPEVIVRNLRIARHGDVTVSPENGGLLVCLTDVAWQDVPWLPLPPYGGLRSMEPPAPR